MKKKLIKKIMLISPPYTLFKDDIRRCVPPIGLTYIAAVLERNGYDVQILDAAVEGYMNLKQNSRFVTYGLSDEEIREKIIDFNPDIVGVSCIFSTQHQNAKRILRITKSITNNIITFVGGSHPTYRLDEALNNKDIDYVITYEGEFATLNLVNTLNQTKGEKDESVISKIGGVAFRKNGRDYINSDICYIQNLDSLPFPARHLLNMEKYFEINLPQSPYPKGQKVAQLVTSRGCTARCVFCTATNFWGNRYRTRSAENVIEEIGILKEKYKIDEIQITDDNFTLNKKRAKKIIEHMSRFGLHWCMPQGVFVSSLDEDMLRRMRDSECYQLTFAIESGNQEVLQRIIKKPLKLNIVKPLVNDAHGLGIKVHAFFVCGFPGETKQQMHETFQFAKDTGFDSASFFLATPLVGSELMKICKENNYLRRDFGHSGQLYKLGNISTPDFSFSEAEELVKVFNKEFNKKNIREKRFDKEKY